MAEVTGDELDREIFEVVTTACRSNETSDLFTTFEQNSDEVRSDKPGSSCDKGFHDSMELLIGPGLEGCA